MNNHEKPEKAIAVIPECAWGAVDLNTGVSYLGVGSPAHGGLIPCGYTDPDELAERFRPKPKQVNTQPENVPKEQRYIQSVWVRTRFKTRFEVILKQFEAGDPNFKLLHTVHEGNLWYYVVNVNEECSQVTCKFIEENP